MINFFASMLWCIFMTLRNFIAFSMPGARIGKHFFALLFDADVQVKV